MKKDGLSFRHAVELLRAPSAAAFTATPKTVRVLPPPVALDADDKTLLRQVVDYYAERLADEAAGAPARAYLARRGLGSADAMAAHRIGYADRTLGLRLPLKNRKDGAEIRARLERLGVYRESGHEHFNGCVVLPILDAAGDVVGLYGRKIVERQSSGLAKHLYLPGPHRGLWNPAALQSREVILCEALLDALTFWENGHRNVTTAYGVEGFTDDMLEAFVAAKVERVLIAFDRDEGGGIGAEKVAARLMARGIECRRVLFPHGQDANDYARKTTPANKALGVLMNAAQWIGKGRDLAASKPEVSPSVDASSARASSLAAKAALTADAGEAPPTTTTPPQAAAKGKREVPSAPSLSQRGEHWFLDLEEREWRLAGLEKLTTPDVLKVALRLRVGERFHLDAVDLARDADRRRFVERAAEETGLHADLVRRDIGRVLLAVEQAQTEARERETAEPSPSTPSMTAAEKDAALDLLRDPRLLDGQSEGVRPLFVD